MRHLHHIVLALSLSAAPVWAQSQSASQQNNRPAASQAQDQSASKSQQQEEAAQAKTASTPALQSAPDNSMADFNVLGSTPQAAFGHDGP